MAKGNQNYDNIPVPETLGQVFQDACKRGKRTMIRRRISKAAVACAACVSLVLFTGNETVYATLAQIPVIGQMVQFIHSGKGGQITDGATGYAQLGDGVLRIRFEEEPERTPHYTVDFLKGPNRVQLTLDGVRGFDRDSLKQMADQTEGIKDFYFITYLDDSAVRFAMELEDSYDYEVKEYENPGYLDIHFVEKTDRQTGETGWYVRTVSMEMGESLALTQETLSPWNLQAAKTAEGTFTLAVGPFSHQAEAQKVLDEISGEGFEGLYLEENEGARLK